MKQKRRDKIIDRKSSNDADSSLRDKIIYNWKWIAILLFCVTTGFALGKCSSDNTLNAKINSLENQKQLEIIKSRERTLELRERYINEINHLRRENNRLQMIIDRNENER